VKSAIPHHIQAVKTAQRHHLNEAHKHETAAKEHEAHATRYGADAKTHREKGNHAVADYASGLEKDHLEHARVAHESAKGHHAEANKHGAFLEDWQKNQIAKRNGYR
jgi:hypothetical protein